MQVPLQPLTDDEETQLAALLQQSRSAELWHARGVFAAIACDTSQQDITQWLPFVLSKDVEDSAALRQTLHLLLRDRFVVAQCLELGDPLLPSDDEHAELVDFCKGFVRVSQASKVWIKDSEAATLVLPLAVTAGYLRPESLESALPELVGQTELWQQIQQGTLAERLLTLYQHFAPARAERAQQETQTKVGRNDPCPCGSGKKYKKCCLGTL